MKVSYQVQDKNENVNFAIKPNDERSSRWRSMQSELCNPLFVIKIRFAYNWKTTLNCLIAIGDQMHLGRSLMHSNLHSRVCCDNWRSSSANFFHSKMWKIAMQREATKRVWWIPCQSKSRWCDFCCRQNLIADHPAHVCTSPLFASPSLDNKRISIEKSSTINACK